MEYHMAIEVVPNIGNCEPALHIVHQPSVIIDYQVTSTRFWRINKHRFELPSITLAILTGE